MIKLHKKGHGVASGYWVGDSFALNLDRTLDGKWVVEGFACDPACWKWLERNPDLKGMTFDRLSEARAYLNAVCSLDPLPSGRGEEKHRLRRLSPGLYEVTHPDFGASNVTLRRDRDEMWEVYVSDEKNAHSLRFGGRYRSLWHAQANLDEVFETEYPHARRQLKRKMSLEAVRHAWL